MNVNDFRHHLNVKNTENKGQQAKRLYGPYTFDLALPDFWVKNAAQKTNKPCWYIAERFIWLYLGDYEGPAPLDDIACDILEKISS